MTRVLIATNEPIRAKGLESVLRAGGLEIAAVCHDVSELFDCIARCRPEIAVLDMPILPAPEVIHDLHRLTPQCHWVLWPELARSDSLARVTEAVQMIAAFPRPDRSPSALLRELCSPSECELIALAGCGLSNEEIATVLGSDRSTIKKSVRSLSDRLGINDRCDLALYGLLMSKEPDNHEGTK